MKAIDEEKNKTKTTWTRMNDVENGEDNDLEDMIHEEFVGLAEITSGKVDETTRVVICNHISKDHEGKYEEGRAKEIPRYDGFGEHNGQLEALIDNVEEQRMAKQWKETRVTSLPSIDFQKKREDICERVTNLVNLTEEREL